MHLIKRYKIVITVFLLILSAVLFKTFSHSTFRYDAKKWAAPSVQRSNQITAGQSGNLQGKVLIINLDNEKFVNINKKADVINIPSDSLLNKNNLKIVSGFKGNLLIYSSEVYLSARAWMLLSQMGLRDIYILTDDSANEVLKSKFRPDTLFKPEL